MMFDNLGSKVSLIGEHFFDNLYHDLLDPFLIYYLMAFLLIVLHHNIVWA